MAALAIDRMLDAGARPKEDDATNAKDILGLNVQRFALAPTPDPALLCGDVRGMPNASPDRVARANRGDSARAGVCRRDRRRCDCEGDRSVDGIKGTHR